ncbi:hypothetical protein [Wenjunlia tyrosinilytica]|nr:hypothetical protein [Wenjunlia tyrosinilytica]
MAHRPDLIVPTARGILAAGYVRRVDGRQRPDLAVPQVKPSMVPHTVWGADLAVTYHLLGHRVLSEREVTRFEVRGRRPEDYLQPLQFAGWHDPERATAYVPDLVVIPDDPANPFGIHQGEGRRAGFLDESAAFTTQADEPIVDPESGLPFRWGDIVPLLKSRDGRPVAIEVELSQKRYPEYVSILHKYAMAQHLAGVVWFTPKASIANSLGRAAGDAGIADDRFRICELVPWQDGMDAYV